MKKSKIAVLTAVVAAGLVYTAGAQDATLDADFGAEKTPVSKNLFGIFYEDINYAADGGLYGEMVQNRSFEFRESKRNPLDAWETVNLNGEKPKSRPKAANSNPLNKNNTVYAKIDVKQVGDGIANKGYGGMYFEAGKKYPGSVYLRSTDSSVTSVTIAAGDYKKKGAKQFTTKISGITTEWKKYEFTIEPVETTEDGQLGVYADQEGTIDIDFVSLFMADIYRNEPNGLRKDLAEMLEAMHPRFIRFPGGCIVHGMNIADRYQWKRTVGPVEERKETFNFWNYQQSYGIGFYEYFRLCEDIGAEPIPVLSVGMAHSGERDSMGNMKNYIQDALDLIEWATGPATSTWGKIRAEAGHPEPFKLTYLGIGNEDCGDDYFPRYKQIAEAVKAKYPNIKTIISSGFTYNDVNFHNAWKNVRRWEKDKKTANLVDLVDEHYYNAATWFLGNGNRYDDTTFYPRDKAKVFIGEYAAWDDGRRNSLYAALTEAAYMTSIERNGDIIEIASYAPLFAREGYVQWFPDAIWFNNHEVYGTPNYYVQQMFMTHKSDSTVKSVLTQPKTSVKKNSIGGTVGLGTWATTAQFRDVIVTNNDTNKVVYDSNKTKDLTDFREETGSWKRSGKSIVQSSQDANVRMILDNEDEIQGIENYTLQLKAQKTGGAEGFLIMFGVKGRSLYWWNMGGWGNTQSCVEKGTADGRTIIGDSQPLSLDAGRWYNIKIEVKGESFKCSLDGKVMHEFVDTMNFDPLYAHVGETDSSVIVKIVNVSGNDQSVTVNLKGAPALASNATVTYMNGSPDDENSFRVPKQVAPKTETISGVGESFTYTARANSVNIIEVKKQ